MFDLGFGEIAVLAIVLLVVVGPRELPQLLRAVGRGITRLRTMSWELRAQSGIDEIIRDEDLKKDIDAVRSLSRGRIVDAIVNEAMRPPPPDRPVPPTQPAASSPAPEAQHAHRVAADAPAPAGDEAPLTRESETAEGPAEPLEIERPERRRKPSTALTPPDSDEQDEPT